MNIPTYPARPVNGGPLPLALPKTGRWIYEPKVNGWRALVHLPTGAMFNRKGQPLSIQKEFSGVLEPLKAFSKTIPEDLHWLDTEAFDRRHHLGRGSLVFLDAPLMGRLLGGGVEITYAPSDWQARQKYAFHHLAPFNLSQPWAFHRMEPEVNHLLWFSRYYETFEDQEAKCLYQQGPKPDPDVDPLAAWQDLREVNAALKAELFEGLVAKRIDSLYPIHLRSPDELFPFWMKHRWAF